MLREQKEAKQVIVQGGRTIKGMAVAVLNDLPDEVAAKLGPRGENIYDMVLRQQISEGEAIDADLLGMVMGDPALEGIFTKVAAIESGEVHQPLSAAEPLKEERTVGAPLEQTDDVIELEPIVVIGGAYSPSLKEQAFNVLGDAKEFADTLPKEQVGLGMLVLGAVTGGPVKFAFSQGLDMVTDAVIGGSVQAAQDDISKWLAGWSLDLHLEQEGSPIDGIEKWLDIPETREDAQHQINGASFGLELFGALFGIGDPYRRVTRESHSKMMDIEAEGNYSKVDDPANTYRSASDGRLRASEDHPQPTGSYVREPGTIATNENYEVVSIQASSERNQEMLADGYTPAWRDGGNIETGLLKPGQRIEMIVTEDQLASINQGDMSELGRWGSENPLPSAIQAARDVAAVKKEWKDESSSSLYRIELEVRPDSEGIITRRGENGPVFDEGLGRRLPGGLIQHEFIEDKAKKDLELKSFFPLGDQK